jgi:glycosyltransferase involved in cell wall biosynthesis
VPDDPLVTVVIPAWDAYTGAWLDEAIASVRAQDVPAEVVVVDNANDPPLQRDGVRLVRSGTRLSVGAARNLGAASVATPLTVIWDADDVMAPGMLRALLAALGDDRRFVACAPEHVDYDSGARLHWPRRWPLAISRWPRVFAALNAVHALYPVIGAAVRTEHLEGALFPDTDGGDDRVAAMSLAFRGRIAVARQARRRYRRHPDSISSRWTAADARAHQRMVRQRLVGDPAVPRAVVLAVPLIGAGHWLVSCLLRPLRRGVAGLRGAPLAQRTPQL